MQVVCDQRDLSTVNKKVKAFSSLHHVTPQSSKVLSLNTSEDNGNALSIVVFLDIALFDLHFELKSFFLIFAHVKDDLDNVQSLALEMTGINLYGYKAVLHKTDPVTDMLLSRRQEGKDVRRDISELHSQKPGPKKLPHPRLPMVTAEQRLLDRCHAGVDLEVFNLIERANRARERDEAQRKMAEQVLQAQARREEAREYRDMFMEGRRKEALERREQEQTELQNALLRLKAERHRDVQAARERHALFLEKRKLQKQEQAKVSDFCRRHLSLCKVIASQQARQRQDAKVQERQSLVMSTRQHVAKQKQLIQNYLERR